MGSFCVYSYVRISMLSKEKEGKKEGCGNWMEGKKRVRILTSELTSKSCLRFSLSSTQLGEAPQLRVPNGGTQRDVKTEEHGQGTLVG